MIGNKVIGVIPARFGSSRLPGKMLVSILGKSLIRRTYENAKGASSLKEIVVATDDERIYSHVKDFGGKVFMTSPAHPTGTDRVAEVIQAHFPDADFVVNIQGDEPCLNCDVIDGLVHDIALHSEAVMTTSVVQIADEQDVANPSVVKCVFTTAKRALYFSRSPIPFQRSAQATYYRHLGLYCFRKEFLLYYANLPKTPLQQIEDLEQLKILELGFPIYVSIVQDEGIGVDTWEDLKRVEKHLLCKENISSLQAALSPR